MSNLIKLRLSLSGSSLSAQKAANGILTAGVVALSHRAAAMTDRFVQHHARRFGPHPALARYSILNLNLREHLSDLHLIGCSRARGSRMLCPMLQYQAAFMYSCHNSSA